MWFAPSGLSCRTVCELQLLKNDPDATVPIAGAFMLAPLEVLLLTPLPAIGINAHAMFRLEVVSALEMPALPFGVTCDSS